ncbi:MAG: 30S ribosomal protein S16, partial [Gemmatimonadales bacterium]
MATRIRLRRVGRKGLALYRIVIAEKEFPRDGRFIETIGHYHPRAVKDKLVQVDA